MTGTLSVVVACHNQAGFVAAAIDSILAQSRAPDEIIVVDDGSHDGSAAVVRGFGDRVRLIVQPNRGAAAARNAGVAAATGALLAFLDADDLWPPASLASRLDHLERTGAALVFGRVRQSRGADDQGGPAIPGRLAGAMLIRRAAFDRVGGFDERYRTAETIDWLARADEAGIVQANCDAVVLIRRIHGGNLMIRTAAPAADSLRVLRGAVARRRALS